MGATRLCITAPETKESWVKRGLSARYVAHRGTSFYIENLEL